MKKLAFILEKVYIPACMIIYMIVIFKIYRCDFNEYLWGDEAGQFWIAKGLNHDSNPMSPTGNVVDVIRNNRDYNMDPGGFGVLLHFWSMIDNGYVWLRSLPLLFFIGTILSFVHLTFRWTKNRYIATIMGFVPVFTSMISKEMLIIRAYSMEIMGVVVAIIAIDYLREKITTKRLLLFSLLISLFMTSRYSFIIVAFVTSMYICYLIYVSEYTNKHKIVMAVVYSLPLFLTLLSIYFLTLRYQNPGLVGLDYLVYISSEPSILLKNSNLVLFFKLALIVWICLKLKGTALFSKYIGLAFVTLSTNLIFLFLSILGKHPWGALDQKCVSMVTLVVISSVAFWSEILKSVETKVDIKHVVLFFVLFQYINPMYINPLIKSYIFKDLSINKGIIYSDVNELQDLQLLPYKENARFYVESGSSPCVRYQFEYGRLKGEKEKYRYPENFVFVKGLTHSSLVRGGMVASAIDWINAQPCMNDLTEFDVLIAPGLYRYHPQNSDKWKPLTEKEWNSIWIKKEADEK